MSETHDAESELAGRLDDAWHSRGDYRDDDLDVLRSLCGEAGTAVEHLAARIREMMEQEKAKAQDPDRVARAEELARTTTLSFWEAWDRAD